MVKIDRHVPAPRRSRRGPWFKYDFFKLNVGESYLIEPTDRRAVDRQADAAYKWGKNNRRKFMVGKDDSGKPRIWRVE
jgi:hypothetical protein